MTGTFLRVTAHGAAAHDEDEAEIHLPAPSFSPVIIAIGVTLACFGLLWSPLLIALGGVVFMAGLVTWLVDDAREFGKAGDHGAGHGGH